MKISELILELEKIKEKEGDLICVYEDNFGYKSEVIDLRKYDEDFFLTISGVT